MIPYDIHKELPYFKQEMLTEEQIKAARSDGLILLHDSPKGKIWYKLPEKDDEDEDEEMPYGWAGEQ